MCLEREIFPKREFVDGFLVTRGGLLLQIEVIIVVASFLPNEVIYKHV